MKPFVDITPQDYSKLKKELKIDANRQQDAAEVLMVILKHLGLVDIRQNQAIESRRCTKCETARMSDVVYSHIPLNISSNVKEFQFPFIATSYNIQKH